MLKEQVEKYMPTLERFEEIEKQVFFPIPAPREFSATIRIYASTMAREALRNILAEVDKLTVINPYDCMNFTDVAFRQLQHDKQTLLDLMGE